MPLLSISFQNFRNLKPTTLNFNEALNFLWGENASGKTSLLEAVYLMSTGRSFRTRQINNIVEREALARELVVFGRLHTKDALNDAISVGVRKSQANGSEIKIDRESVRSAAILARLSPVLLIEPDSFELLNGAPKLRRQFIDWGVFHVEHNFSNLWNEYIYCLKQRNSLLRTVKMDALQLRVWDKKLSLIGADITAQRQKYMALFTQQLNLVLDQFSLPLAEPLNIGFYQGWDRDKSFSDILEISRKKDIERKYTQYGPHRADLKLRVGKKSVTDILSRGQQKLLIIALYIAHVKCMKDLIDAETVVLIDDVAAELDSNNMTLVINNLIELDAQVICTILDDAIPRRYLATHGENCKMFHVEHGVITNVSN